MIHDEVVLRVSISVSLNAKDNEPKSKQGCFILFTLQLQ